VKHEIPFKQWRAEEALRLGISTGAVWYRLLKGRRHFYPGITLRRVNQRVVFVQLSPT
jgi:hypothetical protein